MHAHFADEWQRLARLYADKTDDEVLELSAQFADLTETAQQVLRDELSRRRLPQPIPSQLKTSRTVLGHSLPTAAVPSPESAAAADPSESSLPRGYTWKTLLCECRDQQHAWQISAILRDSAIENWIELPRGDLDLTGPRVLVAADQLVDARTVAERPVPQVVVDLSKAQNEDFTLPRCPQCCAPDPMLLGVDPMNTWRCAAQWTT
jgi:hypothetical protein